MEIFIYISTLGARFVWFKNKKIKIKPNYVNEPENLKAWSSAIMVVDTGVISSN
jgi:hypothetical protein